MSFQTEERKKFIVQSCNTLLAQYREIIEASKIPETEAQGFVDEAKLKAANLQIITTAESLVDFLVELRNEMELLKLSKPITE